MKQVLKEQSGVKTIPSIINEGVVFNVPEKFKKYNDGKIVFHAALQTADTRNQNKRVYPKDVLVDAIKRIQNQIDERRFLGELDHPISDNQVRSTTVELKNCSHLIRKVWWDGLCLMGEVESLPYTQAGRILSGMIADQIPVGFSLRGLSDIDNSCGYQKVIGPMVMISYDAVSNPSHLHCNVKEICEEGKISQIKENKVLKILEEAKNFISLSDGSRYTPNTLDMLIERKIIHLGEMYI